MTTEQEDETGISLSLIFYCIHKKAAWQLIFSGVLRKCLKTQVILNAICFAVGHVHLAVNELVATKDYRRPHSPSEEQLVNALVFL